MKTLPSEKCPPHSLSQQLRPSLHIAICFVTGLFLSACLQSQPEEPLGSPEANDTTNTTPQNTEQETPETNDTPSEEVPTEWTVENNGQVIHARSIGRGDKALVVINGGPGQSRNYCESTDSLASSNLRVVTFDQRGTGKSPHPANTDYSMDAYVSDLEALRIDLGLESIHLLGHSFGGSYAIAYTAEHPERVASLQLFASSPVRTRDSDTAEFERRIAAYEANGTFPNGYDNFEGNNNCAFYFQTIWPVYLHDPTFPMTESLRATTCDVETFIGTNNSNPRGWDFRQEVKTYTGPVAVYYGEADPFINETKSIPKYFEATNVLEEELNNCGHYWEECADDLMPRLLQFLMEASP